MVFCESLLGEVEEEEEEEEEGAVCRLRIGGLVIN